MGNLNAAREKARELTRERVAKILSNWSKTCSHCKAIKSLDDFRVSKTSACGFSSCCTPCAKQKDKEKYHADIEASRRKCRKYWNANPNSKHRLRANRHADPERMERERVGRKRHYWANHLDCLARAKRYRQNNPDAVKHHSRLRRQRLAESEGSYSAKDWENLCTMFGNQCISCGNKEQIEADHIVPITKKGTSYISNIQPLCRSCNIRKGNRVIIDYRLKHKIVTEVMLVEIY